MNISIAYNNAKNDIKLIMDNTALYEETADYLAETKESLCGDIEVDMVVDELNKTYVCKSRHTSNTFKGHYKKLDADEICYGFHEVATMDNVVIYLEAFTTVNPIGRGYQIE